MPGGPVASRPLVPLFPALSAAKPSYVYHFSRMRMPPYDAALIAIGAQEAVAA